MEKTEKLRRSAYGPQRTLLYSVKQGRGHSNRRLSHTSDSGWLPLFLTGCHSHADRFFVASLSAASWHQSYARFKVQNEKKDIESYPNVFFNIYITRIKIEKGKPYLLVVIDRTSKFIRTKLFLRATLAPDKAFLKELIATVPYNIHTIVTDKGILFAGRPQNRTVTTRLRGHPFDRVCRS